MKKSDLVTITLGWVDSLDGQDLMASQINVPNNTKNKQILPSHFRTRTRVCSNG